MKLFHSPASPYVRKVMVCAILRGLDGRIETVPCDPHASPADLLAANPLSKVPTMIDDQGVGLFDSPVICEALDAMGDAPSLYPTGPDRVKALRLAAIGDGIMDAAVARRGESAKPEEAARTAAIARMKAAVERALAVLEAEADSLHSAPTIGTVAVGVALGYLDFRFAHEPWRDAHPKLAAWFAGVSETPAFTATAPFVRG